MQKFGEDYDVTMSVDNVLLVLSTAVNRDWNIDQLDIESAYSYAFLHREIYMRQPDRYDDHSGKVYQLNNASYSFKGSPSECYRNLKDKFDKIGFKPVYEAKGPIYKSETHRAIIMAYVNVILIMHQGANEVNRVKEQKSNTFDFSKSGEPESYLLPHISRTQVCITVDGRKKVQSMLDELHRNSEA